MRESGVTLIELMIAIALVMLIVSPLMLIILESMKGIVASGHYTRALAITEDSLERWKNITFNASINRTEMNSTTHTFPGGLTYNVVSFITTTTSPGPQRRVRVRTQWQGDGRSRSVEMETIIHEGW